MGTLLRMSPGKGWRAVASNDQIDVILNQRPGCPGSARLVGLDGSRRVLVAVLPGASIKKNAKVPRLAHRMG